jgi:transposase
MEGPAVRATIESMNGARSVHDALEFVGWEVLIADAQRVRGLAPLAAKTDKIDARVLAELTRRALVPEIWLPTPEVRAERERARFRLHLVRHRTALKNRIHAILIAFALPCPMTDLFGVAGRELLDRLQLPEPWQADLVESLILVDDLTARIDVLELELRRLGADHPSMRLLMTVPGVGSVLAYTIASEIGDVGRFASQKEACRVHGPLPARPSVGRQGPARSARQVRDRAIVSILKTTAARNSSVRLLRLDDVDVERAVIRFRRGKGGKTLDVALHPETRAALSAYVERGRPTLLGRSPAALGSTDDPGWVFLVGPSNRAGQMVLRPSGVRRHDPAIVIRGRAGRPL